MENLIAILLATWDMYLDTALWLVVGIAAAGAIHVWLPDGLLGKWLGGEGVIPVVKAALIGAPLPLCSCGVLPAAVGLRKDGASKGATVSFLIATPETGPDSVALSYALLGPVMAIVRPAAAIISAIVSGLLTMILVQGTSEPVAEPAPTSCCGSSCCDSKEAEAENKLWASLRYGLVEILDDIAVWLAVGLVLAGILSAVIEPKYIAEYGYGLGAMLIMVAVGIPIYVCATASTPIAAGLIAIGVSPGTALVFLLVGPATNIATLGVVGKDLGIRVLAGYLVGIVASALVAGYVTDELLRLWGVNVSVQIEQVGEALPEAMRLAFGLGFLPFFVLSLWRSLRCTIR